MDRNTSFRICVVVFTVILKIQGIYTLKTRDLQCKLHGYDAACLDNTDSCTQLTCGRIILDSYYVAHTIKFAAEEGTQCGENKWCKRRKCVPVNLPMPAYEGCENFKECRSAQPIVLAQTRNQQCIRYGYKGACTEQSTVCSVLYCAEQTSLGDVRLKIVPRWGVDMGTECGENKICVNMRCVDVIGEMPIQLGPVIDFPCKKRQRGVHDLRVKTRDEQCKQHGFDVACYFHERALDTECTYLRCGYETIPGHYILQNNYRGRPTRVVNPTERTRCGDNRICNNMKCVDETHGILLYTGEETSKTCFMPKKSHTTTCH